VTSGADPRPAVEVEAEPAAPPQPVQRARDPMLLVLAGVVIGVAVSAAKQPQAGLFIIAGSLAGGAVCRLLLRPRAAGSLVVRNRQVDVAMLAALAAAIAVLASVTPFPH
jgi:hypothetical protein